MKIGGAMLMPQISGCKARSCFLVFGLALEKLNRTEQNVTVQERNALLIRLNNENQQSEYDVNFHNFHSEDVQKQKYYALLRTDMPLFMLQDCQIKKQRQRPDNNLENSLNEQRMTY